MNLGYTVQIWQEGEHYIAHAMPLDVASSGPTPAKARSALKEAVNLFLKTAREAGTLKQILADSR
jgi:predicted RNase H-like HicB family nuclease